VYLGAGLAAYVREARAALEAQEFSRFLEIQATWKQKILALFGILRAKVEG
jgi:hypothetical protein